MSADAKYRLISLDALRGLAIVGMVLSSTIAGSILPAWMYHMQEPPPSHEFHPEMTGLTWVDLVFPFFLFAMGAAFNFTVGKQLKRGVSRLKIAGNALLRCLKLAFFAILIQHFYPYMMSNPQDVRSWVLALCCFVLLFPMFTRWPVEMPGWVRHCIQVAAFTCGLIMLETLPPTFDLRTSNPIILIMANMSLLGAIAFIFTSRSWKAMLAVLTIAVAVLLGMEWLAVPHPLDWLLRVQYVPYLIIVLAGSVAGGLRYNAEDNSQAWWTIATALLITVVCLVGSYCHMWLVTFILTLVLVTLQLWKNRLHPMVVLAAILLVLGLIVEPFTGGIKKDGPSLSYLLITAGLACQWLMMLAIVCDQWRVRGLGWLSGCGQNPMVAYVACDLLIYPIMQLTGAMAWLSLVGNNPWLGVLQGILLTTVAVIVTVVTKQLKLYWRT